MTRLADLARTGAAQLAEAGIDGAAREARQLLGHAASLGPARLAAELDSAASADLPARFGALIARRRAREPMSHILGSRAFFNHDFAVGPEVLDPRPETETLVLAALERPFGRLLDLGTGSGAILLSLLAARPEATGLGTDLSHGALKIAQANAARLGVDARAEFALSDWFGAVTGRFDLIASNPPYIAEAEMADLAPELSFEPRMALTDGADGLTAYRAICAGALAHLAPGGWLMVEIGWRQGRQVADMMRDAGLGDVQIRNDLDGRDRVVTGQAARA